MSTHIISGFITHTTYPWSPEKVVVGFTDSDTPFNNEYTVSVAPHSFEVTVPDNFNPNPLKVAAMQEKIAKIKVAAYDEVRNLEDEIGKLLCLPSMASSEPFHCAVTKEEGQPYKPYGDEASDIADVTPMNPGEYDDCPF